MSRIFFKLSQLVIRLVIAAGDNFKKRSPSETRCSLSKYLNAPEPGSGFGVRTPLATRLGCADRPAGLPMWTTTTALWPRRPLRSLLRPPFAMAKKRGFGFKVIMEEVGFQHAERAAWRSSDPVGRTSLRAEVHLPPGGSSPGRRGKAPEHRDLRSKSLVC